MLNLTELEQFVCFADCKTLSKAAEIMHISQPTITRSMQHIEDEFGVNLFDRTKNKIALNETGQQAAMYARKLVEDSKNAVSMVRMFDRSLRTINVESCAPVPIWTLIPGLSSEFPQNTVASKLEDINLIIDHVRDGQCEIGVIPYEYENKKSVDTQNKEQSPNDICDMKYLRENLYVAIPEGHVLYEHDKVTFKQLNGFNCLLKDEIGFWTQMCYRNMPASRFLIQKDDNDMAELIKSSTLLCFVTEYADWDRKVILKKRKIVPIVDSEANVTYHIIYKKKNKYLAEKIENISKTRSKKI